MMIRLLMLLLIASTVLSACSSNKKKDETDKVAKLVKFEATAGLKRVWSADTGKGIKRRDPVMVPALADGKIYASDKKGQVSAYDADTGKLQWRIKTKLRIAGGVSAHSGYVFFGTYDAEIVALDAATGEQKWLTLANGEIISAPASNGDIVVVQTLDAKVLAVDIETGKERWSYDHVMPVLTLRGLSSPVATATQVICAFDNGQIISFSASDGALQWDARASRPQGRTDLEKMVDIDSTPVISRGLVYAGAYQGNLIALSKGKGKPLWSKSLSTFQNLTVSRGKVFVSTERSKVVAFNAANGDKIWENEQLYNRRIGAPARIGDYLAVIDKDEYLHLLSQEDGSFAYRFKPSGKGFHSPIVSDGETIYILGDKGRLSAYRLAD